MAYYNTPYQDTVGRLTHMAYFDQEQLGWEQALRGQLSKRWGEVQDQYYKDRFPEQHNTGDTWTTKVINTLWEYAKAICQERNFAYHGVDDAESHIKRTDDLYDLIVRSFQLDCKHVAFHPTPLFKKPIKTILEQPNRAWLRSVDAVLMGYRLRVPIDPSQQTTQQLWQGTTQTTRHRRLRDETT